MVVIVWFKLQIWMWVVDLKNNFEWDQLIELSDNKLAYNNLASKLVEFLLTNHNRGNYNFYD